MRVFVTGASGYIGSAVAGALSRAGHEVLGLVRSQEKGRQLARAEIEPVEGAMDDPGVWMGRAVECEVVVHCAAEYSARFHELDRRTVDAVLAAQSGSGLSRTFVYTSGVWLYGDTRGARVDESAPLRPPAMVAPRAGTEKVVLAGHRGSVRTLVLRPGCVYGARGGLTAAWFESSTKSGAARIVGDGACRWTMIHVEDLAALYRAAVESTAGGEVFNATDRSRFSVLECARAASSAAGAGGAVESLPSAEASRIFGAMAECLGFDQHVDSSRAVRRFGWQPRHSGFVDEAQRCFRSWKANQG